jgi:Chitin synthesis regulation, resistance to Congo red
VNRRRIKRGGAPYRYTGWTVPTYNQSQQQYGYTGGQNSYNMNNYPSGPNQYSQGQYNYGTEPQYGNNAATRAPAYFDASQPGAAGIID